MDWTQTPLSHSTALGAGGLEAHCRLQQRVFQRPAKQTQEQVCADLDVAHQGPHKEAGRRILNWFEVNIVSLLAVRM